MSKQILILGGYGNLGYCIAELLIRETKEDIIIIAGKNEKSTQKTAALLNDKYVTHRFESRYADASDYKSLISAFEDIDIVINAAGTLQHTRNIVEAAIGSKIDYLDTNLSLKSKSNILKSFEKEILRSELCFITDAGAHPGLPAAMVRYAATFFDEITKADVIASIQYNWEKFINSPSTAADLVSSFKEFRPLAYRDGTWKRIKWREYKRLDSRLFANPKLCYPIFLEEMEYLPIEFPSLLETGFFYPGFNWFVDYILMPLAIISQGLFGNSLNDTLGKILFWSLRQFTDPLYNGFLRLEAEGILGEVTKRAIINIAHHDFYYMAAIPVVACLKQYLHNDKRVPGLWYQGLMVDPQLFFKDIARMGIRIELVVPSTEKTKVVKAQT